MGMSSFDVVNEDFYTQVMITALRCQQKLNDNSNVIVMVHPALISAMMEVRQAAWFGLNRPTTGRKVGVSSFSKNWWYRMGDFLHILKNASGGGNILTDTALGFTCYGS